MVEALEQLAGGARDCRVEKVGSDPRTERDPLTLHRQQIVEAAAGMGKDDVRIRRALDLAVTILITVLVLVGGLTRLTESGLSITEWKPVTGSVPPLSEAHWQELFAKYRQTPEFRLVNFDMTLEGFKTIFWWEWAHRILGRVIGAAFLLPLLFFLWRGWIGRDLRWPLFGLFALGAIALGFLGKTGW